MHFSILKIKKIKTDLLPGGRRHIHKHSLSWAPGSELVPLPNAWKCEWGHMGDPASPGNGDTSTSTLTLGSESKTLSGA